MRENQTLEASHRRPQSRSAPQPSFAVRLIKYRASRNELFAGEAIMRDRSRVCGSLLVFLIVGGSALGADDGLVGPVILNQKCVSEQVRQCVTAGKIIIDGPGFGAEA